MKKIISMLLVVIMIFGTVTVLSSCGAPKNDGAEIRIYLGNAVFDFDPSEYYVSTNAEQVLSLLYEPLFTVNENGKVKGAAAKKYDVDKEERKIVIELRDTFWSDDVQLSAADFVYAWCERIITPDNPNPAVALFHDIEGVKEFLEGEGTIFDIGIEATEAKKLTITYCEGADYKSILRNLASVATAPVRQDVVEGEATYWSKSANTIITNGAFKLKSYNKVTGEFELQRNKGYHQLPTIKDYDNKVKSALLYSTFTTTDNEYSVSYSDLAKNAEKITFIMSEMSLAERAANKKKAEVADHTSTYTYVFNTEKALFADVNVRLALSAIIDREAIVEAITFGKPADGFIPDLCGGSDIELISTKANEQLAREYLAKVDPALIAANKSFTLKIDSDEQSIKIAELVEEAWEKLGFEVTVVVVAPKTSEVTVSVDNSDPNNVKEQKAEITDSGIQYLIKDAAMLGKRDYDVIAVDWQMYSTDPLVGLATLSGCLGGMGKDFYAGDAEMGDADYSVDRINIAAWYDAGYDEKVLGACSVAADSDVRDLLTDAAESALINAMPVCPLVFNQNFVFTNSKISGLKFDGFGNLMFTNVKLAGYKNYYKPEETEE